MKQNEIMQMSFRIDKVLAKEFKSQCALRGKSMQDVIVHAIKAYITQKNDSNPE